MGNRSKCNWSGASSFYNANIFKCLKNPQTLLSHKTSVTKCKNVILGPFALLCMLTKLKAVLKFQYKENNKNFNSHSYFTKEQGWPLKVGVKGKINFEQLDIAPKQQDLVRISQC